MKIKNNDQSQLTLALPLPAPRRVCRPRILRRSSRRASRWFNHMTKVVDDARDWNPAPLRPDEQSHTA